MPSSFTPSLRLEIQASGENDTSWGDKTNANLSAVLEPAIAGAALITMSDIDHILTVGYGTADEARNAVIVLGGVNSASRNVICPSATKLYVVRNLTSGGFPIVFKTATGSGVTVANGSTISVFCDGSKVISASELLDETVTPGKINKSTSNAWRFNGALGLGRDQPVVSGYGVFGMDGTLGSYIPMYAAGEHIGTMNATASAYDFSSLTKPITFTTASVLRMTIANNGAVTFSGPLAGTSGTFSGAVSGTTGTFSGALSATTGTFTGLLSANAGVSGTTGAFTGALSAASGAFSGAVSGTTGTFSGALSGLTVTQTSDERKKHNWRPLPKDIISQVAAIERSGLFDWNDGGSSLGTGAQSLQRILPQAVEKCFDGTLSVNAGGAAMALVVELCRAVEELKNKK